MGHIVSLLHMGDMPMEKTLYNTEMFAKRVIPQLRDIWSEYEDHWMPNPLAADDRATPRAVPGREIAAGNLSAAPAEAAPAGDD